MYKKSKNIILFHSGWWWNVMNGKIQRFGENASEVVVHMKEMFLCLL